MHVVSVNVGQPREVEWQGELVETSIFKTPVSGAVRVGRLNLDGDRQADLTVHGGERKAVYVYASEHYPLWREELGVDELPWGSFGENLTISGLTEEEVHIGDKLRIGSAEFIVTQPRQPCFKLNVKFRRNDMVRRFWQSGRFGFYVAVVREGELAAGDAIVLEPHPDGLPLR